MQKVKKIIGLIFVVIGTIISLPIIIIVVLFTAVILAFEQKSISDSWNIIEEIDD